MNFFQKLLVKAAGVATKNLKLVPSFLRYAWRRFTFQSAVEDGYRVNSAVFACVSALAFSFPEAPLLPGTEVEGKFTPDYDSKLLALIKQPNPDMGEAEFMAYAIVYASLGGKCLIWKQRNKNGEVFRLWPFSIAQMNTVPGESTAQGFVKEYEFINVDGGKPIRIPKEDVIDWKWMPDPLEPWNGMGAIQAAAREVEKDSEASAYIFALLKNNAVPPIVITLTENDELTTVKAQRLRKEWNAIYGKDGEGAGGPAFLEAGMKAEKLGFDLQQLAAETLSSVPEARIAACFRVPPVVAGLSVGLKRSDYGDQAARRSFTELTLAALWRSLASEMWSGLKDELPAKPKNFQMQHNLRVVRALQEDETKLWETVSSAFERSLVTRAEAKVRLGIEPKPGDDVYKVSLASEFVAVGEDVDREPAKGTPIPSPSPVLKTKTGEGGDELKARSQRVAGALRKMRVKLAKKMKGDVQTYFDDLADQVVKRATGKKADDLPSADDLLRNEDSAKLQGIVKRYYATIIELSWATWNTELGVELAFDLTDPLVTEILAGAGKSVIDIDATTLDALRSALQYANDNGWGIDELVRGDAENGIPGLRDLIESTYKGRAETISRTELGEAQNAATVGRYEKSGVSKVIILDNGSDDDDDECKRANGQIWTLDYFSSNTLEHPSCTRCAAAYFGDAEADRH